MSARWHYDPALYPQGQDALLAHRAPVDYLGYRQAPFHQREVNMMELSNEEEMVLKKVLTSKALQYLIGAEEWDLTEDEEEILWTIVNRELRAKQA